MFNAGLEESAFRIAEPPEEKFWTRAIDTGLPSPEDILSPGSEKPLEPSARYTLAPRSMAVLISKHKPSIRA
jgi:glycogen operon protein